MRIQPITTTNNNRKTQFKQLIPHKPKEWDVDVLDKVVNNTSIKDFAKYLAEQGKNITLYFSMKPFPILQASIDYDTKAVRTLVTAATSKRMNKEGFFEELAKFDYKALLKKEELDELTEKKRESILSKLEEFNNEITPKSNIEPVSQNPKKKNFLQGLLGL